MATEDAAVSHDLSGACEDRACLWCGQDADFDMPEGLIEACHRKNVVIFAGAGISTEVRTVFPTTVLEMVASRLDTDVGNLESFPQAMEEYQTRFGRAELVRLLHRKFDYISSFRELDSFAKRFHRELATMPYLRDVVTTNWDTYFEDECGATPFVSGEDIALWELPGRRVIKVHGSINNLSSLVATESDYAARLDKLAGDVMGGLLRQLLATKTVVFVGYSLSDWNFRRLYEMLRADMSDFAPRAYVVSPFPPSGDTMGLPYIQTSGVKFLQEIKEQLVGHCFIGDEAYGRVSRIAEEVRVAHLEAAKISHSEFPSVIYCWFYQDGFLDACDRITKRRSTGEYSDRHLLHALLRRYEEWCDVAYEEERYSNLAYLEGYSSGLMMMLDDDWGRQARRADSPDLDDLIDVVPHYFMYGTDSDMRTWAEFEQALEASRRRAPKERKVARRIVAGLAEGMVLNHGPFLPDAPDFT